MRMSHVESITVNDIEAFEGLKRSLDNITEFERLQNRQMEATIKVIDTVINMLENRQHADKILLKALGVDDE